MNLSIPPLQKTHPFRQWLEWKIPNTDLTIEGYSRAGDKTFFYIPQLKTCLDASLAEGRQGDYVLITHSHSDHIADIEYLANSAGVQIYAPIEIELILEDYITARKQLHYSGSYSKALHAPDYSIHGMKAGDRFEIQQKRTKYEVQIVRCDHRVPCIGYAFSEEKTRLKDVFESLKNEMIAQGEQAAFGKLMAEKKKAGISTTECYLEPRFVYLGDTSELVYEENTWLFDYPCIMAECTFLFPENQDKAKKRKHSHWDFLRPIVLAHPQTTFVLIHFSLRNSDAMILEFFKAEQEKYGFENVRLWAC